MDRIFNEEFIDKNIGELCKEYDKIKGANTNLARIMPDVIDGLKRVQRRTLFIIFSKDQGKTYRKVATIDGEVIGKVHPHGPSSVYEAIVNIAQPWNNSIPLIDGHGNFGTPSGDRAGADRYIKARLSEYAYACFFEDWNDSVVDMTLAFDEETKEPLYLPAKYPNILLNGCIGVGYGIASNIPCYNFREVVEACILLMKHPDAKIVLIPDSPTGCDIIENDFARISETGNGTYSMRCTYEIDAENNKIIITSIPLISSLNVIRAKIAEIKSNNGLPELINMDDKSGKQIHLVLTIRDDVNPYKFMKKLLEKVPGLERSFPVNITAVNNLRNIDYSISGILLEWINWRRDQKRIVVNNKRINLVSELRSLEVKIYISRKDNLDETIKIFKESRNRSEIEHKLLERYRNTEIKMDSLQAKSISDMRLIELSIDSYNNYVKRRDEVLNKIKEIEDILDTENGIDKVIVAELRDGIKRFGTPRRSNVVPRNIKTSSEVVGMCILQLSSDGNISRNMASNMDEEPIPTDSNGFAVKVDNDSSFILIDDNGYHSFVKVKDLPVDAEVPVNRYMKQKLNGNIIAMLPVDIESDKCCTLVSRKGMLKRIKISEMGPSKRPCIDLFNKDDKVVKGIVTLIKSQKDLLVYTKNGKGQRFDPNSIRITSPNAKGGVGFKLSNNDEIVGCYSINPEQNQYLLYVTMKGKMRLNLIDYLPTRDSKHDSMVKLITLNDRDRLLSIVGCNRYDKVQVFFDNGETEIIDISKLNESTMGEEPKKVTTRNAVTTNIVKVKLL